MTIATHHLNREWKRDSGGFEETPRHVKTNPGILCQHMEKVMRTGGPIDALLEVGFDLERSSSWRIAPLVSLLISVLNRSRIRGR